MENITALDNISTLRTCVRAIQSEYDRCAHALSRIDLAEQDLLHFVEFETCDAATGYCIFAKLKNVRQQRRDIKDKMEVLQMVRSRLQQAGLFDQKTWGAIDQSQERCRSYRYRVVSKEMIMGKAPWKI